MSDPPTPLSMERGGKGKTAIPEEEKADEPSILPMTPESKQLAANNVRYIKEMGNKVIFSTNTWAMGGAWHQGTAEQNRTEKTTAPEQAKHTRKTKPYLQNRQLISASGSRAGQRLQEEGKYML